MLTIRAVTGGEGYAERHLQQSDSYNQNRTVEVQWHGRGAELLGLKGKVASEDFEAVRQGLDPRTGELLQQRHGADRIASSGEQQSKARSLYDMTFSAPKFVSVMASVGGHERLIAAHETAVREALEEAETYSATRVRLAGLNENRTTRNWIVAAYTHDTSRELDPQLHTHAVAADLTYDGTEGRWKALQASGLYERLSVAVFKRSAIASSSHPMTCFYRDMADSTRWPLISLDRFEKKKNCFKLSVNVQNATNRQYFEAGSTPTVIFPGSPVNVWSHFEVRF